MKSGLKYPGSKWSYAEWITSFFPSHQVYLEPFFGSGAVFFNKKPTAFETINDLDRMVVNFFKICREQPAELSRLLHFTPFSRVEFESVQEYKAGEEIQLTGDPLEDARRFAVRCSQGFGSKLADRCGWKNTKSSKGPINPRVWQGMADVVVELANRLKDAQIECKSALELIPAYNTKDCLIYVDPPYLGTTRSSRMYRQEMMHTNEHIQLLMLLKEHQGPVLVSGYDNELYDETLSGWHKETKQGRTNSASIRLETLWMNYSPSIQMSLDMP